MPGPVAVVVSRFPAVTETFVLRELVELERQGVEVVLVPLLRHPATVVHPDAAPWLERALYSPFLNGPILLANLRALAQRPGRYLGALCALLWEARGSANAFTGTLGVFAKSVWNGERVRARGVRHVHAHFATHPATAAYVMGRVCAPGAELPYSVTVHAHDLFIHQAGLRRKLANAAFVRAISEFNRSFLRERIGLPRERVRVIHCGVRAERYRHAPDPGRPGRDRPARVLSIAALRPYKGLRYLIEAFSELERRGVYARCDVIGEGPLRAELEAQIARAGLGERLRLVGTRAEAEVGEAIARADLFALPSVVADDGQMEGIPVSLMEAMAAGVPVVASDLSGIPELVSDGETGLLVPPGDAAALADAIQRALDDPEGARARAERGRARVRAEFDLEGCVRALARALDEYTHPTRC